MRAFVIGLGKLGKQLTTVLDQNSIPIRGVYNRSVVYINRDNALFKDCFHDLNKVPTDADVYLLSISDDAVKEVASALPQKIKDEKIVVHTSGVHTLEIFDAHIKYPGVLYPLNTFTEGKAINWKETPVYISGSSEQTLTVLTSLAKKISNKVFAISDRQKRILHLSAVMVNNFPTHLFQLANRLLNEKDLEFDHLLPLIRTMVANAESGDLEKILTGPAVRGDQQTIDRHLDLLEKHEEVKNIYKTLTKSINENLSV
ncbi:MAG: DUF2520 domain-containing protein [Bacteroidetes bacterium]|nr:DUF2520 domain-containing protein [Bacteroidota bacterium]